MAAKKAKVSGKGLRVLLFGTPGSGKSSLLGALWQAAQTQEDALGGTINDPSGGLAELHDVVYAKEPEDENDDDLAQYPISLENGSGEALEATLIDCDGELAQECLVKSQAKLDYKNQGCRAILGADAILLLVDPTAGKTQMDKEFLQFCNFIHLIEKYRSTRVDVVGLPIYLVLTKCDAFAKPTDAPSAWLQKVEDGKRVVDKRFQDFLARYKYRSELSFGKIDLQVWATSVKRPALADKAKSQEPYGVAELFRRCFESAREFHDRRQKARHRLQMSLLGYSALIALMACAAAFFIAKSPDIALINLDRDVAEALPSDHKDWLNKEVDDRLAKLAKIRSNSYFTKLPPDTQKKVNDAEVEIKEYQRLNNLLNSRLPPDLKSYHSDGELADVEDRLAEIEIPEKYKESWRETRLIRRKNQLVQDIAGVRKEVAGVETWLKEQVKKSNELEETAINLKRDKGGTVEQRKKWLKDLDDLFKAPYKGKRSDELIPDSRSITYGYIMQFQNEDIAKLRQNLNRNKRQLNVFKENIEEISASN